MTMSGEHPKGMKTLIKLSRLYGSDPDFLLAGGGNTSLKTRERLWIKASGHSLATITADEFVELDRKALDALLERKADESPLRREEHFTEAILAACIHPEKGQRPSVESVLHHLMHSNNGEIQAL